MRAVTTLDDFLALLPDDGKEELNKLREIIRRSEEYRNFLVGTIRSKLCADERIRLLIFGIYTRISYAEYSICFRFIEKWSRALAQRKVIAPLTDKVKMELTRELYTRLIGT